jgi:acyl-coenzyme A thioesterase PaaI-like protein
MAESSTERIRLPWSRSCFVCGEANPQGIRAEIYKVGDLIEMAFVPRREFVGWAEVVHGGIVGTVLDELMTWAVIVKGRRAFFAADMAVRFKAPLPPEQPCVVKARVTGTRRQLLDAESWVENESGLVYARASGRYLPVPHDQVVSFHDDFIWAPGCLDLRGVFAGQAEAT